MSSQPPLNKDAETSADRLSLRVVNHAGAEIVFRVRQTTVLSKVINAYCESTGVEKAAMRFLVDGLRLCEEKTPADYNLEDGDVVDVVLEQTGGCARFVAFEM